MSTLLVDQREYAGLRVSLNFDTDTDTVSLVTLDLGTDEECALAIDPADARDAFEHPGAYGAVRCKCHSCSPPMFYSDDEDGDDPEGAGVAVADDEDIPF